MARNDALLIGPAGSVLLPAAAVIVDSAANPTVTALQVYPMIFDPTGLTWNRLSGMRGALDGEVGSDYLRVAVAALESDAGGLNRLRTIGAGGGTNPGVLAAARPLDTWAIYHEPAANTTATITRAAAGAGIRHVCTGLLAVVTNTGLASPGAVRVYFRDGASGVGTILLATYCNIQALTGEMTTVTITGCQIQGTANTAMTFEFSGAGGASTLELVAMFGYDITA